MNLLKLPQFLLLGCIVAAQASAADSPRDTGPWNMVELASPPEYSRGDGLDGCDEILFQGEPLHGKPTRVKAYLAQPEGKGPFPAVVVTGRGGAFTFEANGWAKLGYISLMVNAYNGGRLPDGGPIELADRKLRVFTDEDVGNTQAYHAVSDTVRALSLLTGLNEVDRERIGVVGDGYLTCVVAGIDDRVKVAVADGCCDFLREGTDGMQRFLKPGPKNLEGLKKWFDTQRYLRQVRCPILFFATAYEFGSPFDVLQTCYQTVPGHVWLSIRPKISSKPPEVRPWSEQAIFVDAALKREKGLARLEAMQTADGAVEARFTTAVPITSALLYFTSGTGPWIRRTWKNVPARVEEGFVRVTLPAERPLAYFLAITDVRGAVVSTPHAVLPKASE